MSWVFLFTLRSTGSSLKPEVCFTEPGRGHCSQDVTFKVKCGRQDHSSPWLLWAVTCPPKELWAKALSHPGFSCRPPHFPPCLVYELHLEGGAHKCCLLFLSQTETRSLTESGRKLGHTWISKSEDTQARTCDVRTNP